MCNLNREYVTGNHNDKKMKDNFSLQSDQYAKYRPTYPNDFFDYLNSIVPNKQSAWDCGTGNGQVAYELAKTFHHVFATDISQSQIDNALQSDNIEYSVQPSENTNFAEHFFDLIVIAQAIHWFDFEKFYTEAKRTAKENALLCVIGYGRIKISEQIDKVITDFYENILGIYWDKERKYVDENYETIPFPFTEIHTPKFVNQHQWTLEHLIGYLNTWSAVKHFFKQNGYNPIDKLQSEFELYWNKDEIKEVKFPLLLRIGKI
jgi:ubiquinone/menaquinone biosynthesis C-methylase UbiE